MKNDGKILWSPFSCVCFLSLCFQTKKPCRSEILWKTPRWVVGLLLQLSGLNWSLSLGGKIWYALFIPHWWCYSAILLYILPIYFLLYENDSDRNHLHIVFCLPFLHTINKILPPPSLSSSFLLFPSHHQ